MKTENLVENPDYNYCNDFELNINTFLSDTISNDNMFPILSLTYIFSLYIAADEDLRAKFYDSYKGCVPGRHHPAFIKYYQTWSP